MAGSTVASASLACVGSQAPQPGTIHSLLAPLLTFGAPSLTCEQRDAARRRREEEAALEKKSPLQQYVELLGSQDLSAWKEWLIGMGQVGGWGGWSVVDLGWGRQRSGQADGMTGVPSGLTASPTSPPCPLPRTPDPPLTRATPSRPFIGSRRAQAVPPLWQDPQQAHQQA